jgi:magnesium-dependent phosphatase 1
MRALTAALILTSADALYIRAQCSAAGRRVQQNAVRADSAAARPKAVIFDLDGCLWFPGTLCLAVEARMRQHFLWRVASADMYMLWGGGAPFESAADDKLLDRNERPVVLLGAVPEILLELKSDPQWAGVVVGVASCTDEPAWAQECMEKFRLADGTTSIKDVMMIEEIRKANKRSHLKSISERTGIALEEILFLDNEWGNCADVSSIGVNVVYTPDGVTRAAWDKALAGYPAPGEVVYG